MNGLQLIATGGALPGRTVTNEELSRTVDTSDEWITTRTGIRARHWCTEEESAATLAIAAAKQALERSGLSPQDIACCVCATLSAPDATPSVACQVQRALGLPEDTPCFDLNAACTGFVYALDVAAGYFARKRVKKVLIAAGDTMTRLLNWQDRSTCVLFGDGAGAVVLGEGDALRSIHLTADGNTEVLSIPHVSGNSPFDTLPKQETYLHMNGKEVYKFAVSSFCRDVQTVCGEAGITLEQVDWLVPHQANMRIIEAAAHKLKFPMERCLTGIEQMGNVSAACIPIVLDRANCEGRFRKGDLLALTAFGAGLTTGACILKW